jgi:hypothetical protein
MCHKGRTTLVLRIDELHFLFSFFLVLLAFSQPNRERMRTERDPNPLLPSPFFPLLFSFLSSSVPILFLSFLKHVERKRIESQGDRESEIDRPSQRKRHRERDRSGNRDKTGRESRRRPDEPRDLSNP